MSVLRQFNFLGQERVDVPHLRSIESSIAADFDIVVGKGLAGDKALILQGFVMSNINVGTSAGDIQLSTASSIAYNINASESGSFIWIPSDRAVEVLNSSNGRVSGSFTANSTNFIGIDFIRSADETTSDLAEFLNADTKLESARTVPLGRTLDYKIIVSTTPFSGMPNVTPIAKVVTDINNNIASVQDARQMMYRLGNGGDFPNYQSSYAYPFGRKENTLTTDFSGGDKNILSQKDWMDAMMTRVWEIGGGENWYSPTADRNVRMVRNPSPDVFTNGDNFEVVSSNLHWRGLSIVFDNANTTGVYHNDIANQLTSSAGLTDLAVGECLYVDIDRTQNRTGGSALVMQKVLLQNLGTPNIPGSRYVIAWRTSNSGSFDVYSRDYPYYVGIAYQVATTTSTGSVKLSRAATTPSAPIVISDTGGTIASPVNTSALTITGSGTGNLIDIALSGSTGNGVRVVTNGGATTGTIVGTAIEGFSGVVTAPGVYGVSGFIGVSGLGRAGVGAVGGIGGKFVAGAGDSGFAGGIGAQIIGGAGGAGGGTQIGGQGLSIVAGNATAGNSAGGLGLSIVAGNGFGTQSGGQGLTIVAGNGGTTGNGGKGFTVTAGSPGGANGNGGQGGQITAGDGTGGGTGGLGLRVTAGNGGASNSVGGIGISISAGNGGGTAAGGAGISVNGGTGGATNGAGGNGITATGGVGANFTGTAIGGHGILGSGGDTSGNNLVGSAGIKGVAGFSANDSWNGQGGWFIGNVSQSGRTTGGAVPYDNAGALCEGTWDGSGLIAVSGNETGSVGNFTGWGDLVGRQHGVLGVSKGLGYGVYGYNDTAGGTGDTGAGLMQMAGIKTRLALLNTGSVAYGMYVDMNGFTGGSTRHVGARLEITGNGDTNSAALQATTTGSGIAAVFSQNGNNLRGTINLVPRGSDPTAPSDGDMWCTSTSFKIRINGVTKTVTLT